MKQPIHPFQIEAIRIFNQEESRHLTYSHEQYKIVKDMMRIVHYHLSQRTPPYLHIEDNRDEFLNRQAYYYEQSDINEANYQICSVGYFAGTYGAFHYDPRHPYLLEFGEHNFDLFFLFKLRQMDLITELDSFLEYWQNRIEHKFTRFYTLLNHKYTCLIDSDRHQSVLEWLEAQKQPIVESSDSKIGLTNKTLALYFYFFKKHFNLTLEEKSEKSDFIKFLHLLQGREFKGLQSSYLKELSDKAPSIGSTTNSIKDLQTVKKHFSDFKLDALAALVEEEINKEENAKEN